MSNDKAKRLADIVIELLGAIEAEENGNDVKPSSKTLKGQAYAMARSIQKDTK